MKKELIYLTGFMGSGKTTVGEFLGQKLECEFIDLDVFIEKSEGRIITDIFKESGESHFRKLEGECLRNISGTGKKIISLGGGALMNEENQKFVKENGALVYLKITPGEIYNRLKHSTNRPLLKKDDGTLCSKDEFIEKISTLFAQREPGYLSAAVTVDTVGKTSENVAYEILISLEKIELRKTLKIYGK